MNVEVKTLIFKYGKIMILKKMMSVFAFALLLAIACNESNEKSSKKIDFCERLKADQSNLSRSHMSKSEKEDRFKKRKATFKENWEIFKELIEKDELSTIDKDNCYKEFILVTLVHNVQNYPEEVFNRTTIDNIKKELTKGNINADYLKTALSSYKNFTLDGKRCKTMKEMVDYAILSWEINENLEGSIHDKIEDIEYIDCEIRQDKPMVH